MEVLRRSNKVVQDTISLKEVIINIENDELEPMINKMMLRFPHLAQDTFKELDNKSMVNCRKVSKIWCHFIDNQRCQWIRKMQRTRQVINRLRIVSISQVLRYGSFWEFLCGFSSTWRCSVRIFNFFHCKKVFSIRLKILRTFHQRKTFCDIFFSLLLSSWAELSQ